MFPLLGIGVGLALLAPAFLHLLQDIPRIRLVGPPRPPRALRTIAGSQGKTRF